MSKEIPLTQGYVAIVDDEDFEYINQWKWWYNNSHYACRNITIGKKKQAVILMHRLILDAPKGLQVDHIDGNGLNNQRSNLRLATNQENQMNRRPHGKTSKYKGVCFYRFHKKISWLAQIKIGKAHMNLGYHSTEEEAAKAYDAKAKELFGEYAYLNFPES